MDEKRAMGMDLSMYKEGQVNNITLSLTEDCNLACRYCYMVGKNKKKKMSYEIAKKAVDYVLENRDIFCEKAVVWDFIGGEPFLEIELLDAITDYIKQKMFIMDHPWFYNYMISMATNGTLYSNKKVQDYIKKNHTHLSIAISVDGTKEKHDLQRVYPDGRGSYDDVIKNVPLWLEQYPNAYTKATFSHGDLPYLKNSVISLWHLGIKDLNASIVFEDVWDENDPIIFEQQLKELSDYIFDNNLWMDYNVSFLSARIGLPQNEELIKSGFCGVGKMLTIDCDGKFYPCIRFTGFSLSKKEGLCIGNVDDGIDFDKLRPFKVLSIEKMSKKECIDCEVSTKCATCAGYNYDNSEDGTIFDRATYNCEMHKANARAVDYFWDKYTAITKEESPRNQYKNNSLKSKYLKIIVDDSLKSHCRYTIPQDFNTNSVMDEMTFLKALQFAKENNFVPVIIGETEFTHQYATEFISILDNKSANFKNKIILFDNKVDIEHGENYILKINRYNISNINKFINQIVGQNSKLAMRINIIPEELKNWTAEDIRLYQEELETLAYFIFESYKKDIVVEVNALTDLLNLNKMCNCDAGVDQYTLAPNGKFYICPGFYYNGQDDYIGDIDDGVTIANNDHYSIKNAPVCNSCDVYHCSRCMFLNKKLTNEYRVPSKNQCTISHVERNTAMLLQKLFRSIGIYFANEILIVNHMDPIDLADNNINIIC
jgi:radical SAM peptide maturase (CXXX-repeat target family)/CXXX repeat peptide maturase